MITLAKYALPAVDRDSALTGLEPFRNRLEKKHILLTGCTGFIGHWLVDTLLWANEAHGYACKLSLVTRSRARLLKAMPHLATHSSVQIVESDIIKLNMVTPAAYDLIILPHDEESAWAARHCQTACGGTEAIFKVAARCGARRVLILSSGGVYATRALAEHVPLREESADMVQRLRESSLYGETKRFVELYAAALGQQYGIEVPIARCFSFCGACLSMNGVNALASFLADALAGRDIVIRGDGTQVRSFLHGSDMVAWLLGMLVAGPDGEPCNVGSTESVSLRELAEQIARLAGGKSEVQVLGKAVPGNAPSIYVPDTSRIRTKLGVEERLSLAEGLRRTLDWGLECQEEGYNGQKNPRVSYMWQD